MMLIMSRFLTTGGMLLKKDEEFPYIFERVLYVEAEVHDVAVAHHIFFAFYSQLTGLSDSGFASEIDVVVVFDDFGTDKPRYY